MESLRQRSPFLPLPAGVLAFLAVFAALYLAAAAVAEFRVGRAGKDSAMQRLLAAQGAEADWLVLGASHALPLDYGDVPARLRDETGLTMIVLAEVGAGPLYSDFALRQALKDLQVRNILYVADSFAFQSAEWNERRIGDRKLLRRTPLRVETLATVAGMVATEGVAPGALLDYATAFSKLNPPDRFPRDVWRGADTFDRRFRPSRHATAARIDYLFPEPPSAAAIARYLGVLDGMIARARALGVAVTVARLPVPEAFRAALPAEAAFDAALQERLAALGVPLYDWSAALDLPALYFDTDHLNRDGVARLYEDLLRPVLAPGG